MRRAALELWLPALASAAAAALAISCLAEALTLGERPFPGFLLYADGAVTSLLRRDWEGPRVGLRPRDVLLEMDGAPVRSGQDAERELARHRVGETLAITAVRPGEATPLHTSVRLTRLALGDIAYVFVMPFAIGVLYLALGAVVYFVKRTRAAALVLALSIVAAAFYLTMLDAHYTYRWSRVWICYPLLGPISVHLFAVFPEERKRVHRLLVLGPLYAIAGALVFLRQMYLYVPSAFDSTSLASGIVLALCFLGDLVLLRLTWSRTVVPAVRSKARSVAFGLVVTITLAVVWAFVSRMGPVHVTADQAMLLSAAFPILICYATLRQNLFDLDAVLQKSLTYGAASALVVGLFVLLVTILSLAASPLATRFSPFATPLTVIISTLVIALAASPLRAAAQRAITRVFYAETVGIQKALVQLGRDLERATSPAELGERVTEQIARVLDLRGAAVLVLDERAERLRTLGRSGEIGELSLPSQGPLGERLARLSRPARLGDLLEGGRVAPNVAADLARSGAKVLVPLRARARLVGLLALGPRRDESELGAGDLELVAAATAPLAIALENATLVAERADRERLAALGGVAAVIVHEIKNPLGIIRVSAGALEKKFLAGDSGRELAQCIVEEVDRMDVTLRQILSFARPQPPALVPCDVGALVERTCVRMRERLEAARARVATDLDGAPPVRADPLQLERVLVNLLENAAQALGESGGGEIRIRTRAIERLLGGGAVEIVIQDTGPGMDEKTRQRLFEPFFTTRPGGTGLGLAIVRQILEEHHGEIAVESEPGRGSTFRVTLPS